MKMKDMEGNILDKATKENIWPYILYTFFSLHGERSIMER